MARKKNKRIIRYKRRRYLNIGTIIFGFTFLYIIINVFMFFTKDNLSVYEVAQGKSATTANLSYSGLVIRDEAVSYAEHSGFINFYVREGERVSLGSSLYTLDESGTISNLLKEASVNESTLPEAALYDIKEQMVSFSENFNETNFESVYDFKYRLEANVMAVINANMLETINEELKNNGTTNLFQINKANKSGIVYYSTDGYEAMNANDVSHDAFDKSQYHKITIKPNDLVEEGSFIYKTIHKEEWHILIPLTKQEIEKYSESSVLEIKFLKDGLTEKANFEIIEGKDGQYGKLTFHKYMLRYAADRFLEIQIVEPPITGLKIPKSSVIRKEFYIIPVDFIAQGGNNNAEGFYKEVFNNEDNEPSVEFVVPTIYYKSEDYCYISKEKVENVNTLEEGTILVKNDSSDRYRIEEADELEGVYCVNKGFAAFRRIEVMDESNEYYIIDKNTSYGLRVYDHIVLNGSTVKHEAQIIFQ